MEHICTTRVCCREFAQCIISRMPLDACPFFRRLAENLWTLVPTVHYLLGATTLTRMRCQSYDVFRVLWRPAYFMDTGTVHRMVLDWKECFGGVLDVLLVVVPNWCDVLHPSVAHFNASRQSVSTD